MIDSLSLPTCFLRVEQCALRAKQLKYDESDDYDEIKTKPDAKNKLNLKYANIIIDKIVELKIKGVKIQSIYIKSIKKNTAIAHGILWCDNEIGLKNAAFLLAQLCDQANSDIIYFSKISFRNVEYRKTPCPVPPLSSPPLKLSKSWSLAKILV